MCANVFSACHSVGRLCVYVCLMYDMGMIVSVVYDIMMLCNDCCRYISMFPHLSWCVNLRVNLCIVRS